MTRWYRIDGELIAGLRAVLGEMSRLRPEWSRVSRALRNELDLLIPDREDFPRLDRSELKRLWDDIFGINSRFRDIPFLQIRNSSSDDESTEDTSSRDQDAEEDAEEDTGEDTSSQTFDLEALLRTCGLRLRD